MTLLPLVLALAMQAAPSPIQTIARGTMSMIDEPRQTVIRSAAELAALWRQHAGEQPPPTVDFNSRTVVAVFAGSRPSAGFAVEITGTSEKGGALVVEWRERRPEKGTVSAQVLTSPFHIVTIPKFAGEITFVKVEP